MKISKKNIVIVLSCTLAVSVLVGGVMLYRSLTSKKDKYSEDEKKDILTEVLINNPDGIVKAVEENVSPRKSPVSPSDNSDDQGDTDPVDPANPVNQSPIPSPEVKESGAVDPVDYDDVIAPDTDVYNYRHTSTEVEYGSGTSLCPFQFSDIENYSSEYSEFFDHDQTFYKYENTDSGGDLDYYYMARYGKAINDYYSYRGGEFAAKLLFDPMPYYNNDYLYEEPIIPSYPESYTAEDIVLERIFDENYFGNNAEVTDVIDDDGKLYYVITVRDWMFCGEAASWKEIITVYKVDSETYAVVEKKKFIDRVRNDNRLYTETIDTTRDMVDALDVADEFEFDYEVDLRVVDYAAYEYDATTEYNKVVNHLVDDGIEITYPELDSTKIWSFSGRDFPEIVENEQYHRDRSFYRPDSHGEEDYQSVIAYYNEYPMYRSYYNNDDYNKSINIEYFDQYTADEIRSNYYEWYEGSCFVEGTDSITVNGQTKNVEFMVIYYQGGQNCTYPSSYPGSYPTSYPASYPVSYPASYPGYSESFLSIIFLAHEGGTFEISSYNDEADLMNRDYRLVIPGTPAFSDFSTTLQNFYVNDFMFWY